MCSDNIPNYKAFTFLKVSVEQTNVPSAKNVFCTMYILYIKSTLYIWPIFPVVLLKHKLFSKQSQIHCFSRILVLSSVLLPSCRTSIFANLKCPNVWETLHHILSSSKLFEVRKRVTAAYRIPVSSIQQVPRNTIGWIEPMHCSMHLENSEWGIGSSP